LGLNPKKIFKPAFGERCRQNLAELFFVLCPQKQNGRWDLRFSKPVFELALFLVFYPFENFDDDSNRTLFEIGRFKLKQKRALLCVMFFLENYKIFALIGTHFKKAFVCFDARVFKCDPFGAERDKVFFISFFSPAHKFYLASAPI